MVKHDERVAVRVPPEANGQAAPAVDLARAFHDIRDELLSALLFILGNREDAKDAAQNAFIKCWHARGQLDEVLNLRAWIFRVAFNTAKDMRRSAWSRRAKPLEAEQHTLAGREACPASALEKKEIMESLRRAVLDLREEEREVFLLRQNGDLTYEQIAEVRGCPVGTIKTQMRAALEKLRQVLR